MCNVVLAGSSRSFPLFNQVNVLLDRIEVYNFDDDLVSVWFQGKQERNEFESFVSSLLIQVHNHLCAFNWDNLEKIGKRL